jgi:hypothetical protein
MIGYETWVPPLNKGWLMNLTKRIPMSSEFHLLAFIYETDYLNADKPIEKPLIQFKDVFMKFGFTAVMIRHEIPDVFYFSQRIVMLDRAKFGSKAPPKRY